MEWATGVEWISVMEERDSDHDGFVNWEWKWKEGMNVWMLEKRLEGLDGDAMRWGWLLKGRMGMECVNDGEEIGRGWERDALRWGWNLKGRMGMERERDGEWIRDMKEENGEWSSEGRMNGSLSWNWGKEWLCRWLRENEDDGERGVWFSDGKWEMEWMACVEGVGIGLKSIWRCTPTYETESRNEKDSLCET